MEKIEVGAPRESSTREGRLLLAFTMSLDGFVAGPDVRAGQAMGRAANACTTGFSPTPRSAA